MAGRNYGQGSSREHAALGPMYLGIKGVIARSFARIHRANLINFGILPMTFSGVEDLKQIRQGDRLVLEDVARSVEAGQRTARIVNSTQGNGFSVRIDLDERERNIVVAGGRLNHFVISLGD